MNFFKYFYLFVILVFFSCRRKGDVSGKIINILNGKPIEGLTVHVDEYKLRLITDKTITKHLETATTNSNGEYFLKYGPKLETRYKNKKVYIDSENFYGMDTAAILDVKYDYGNYPGCEITSWDYKGHSRKNQDFYLAPLSRIKIIPHNITNMWNGLTMRVYFFDNNYSDLAAYYSYGNTSDFNYYVQFPSNGKIYIQWVIEFSSEISFYDSINVAPFAKTIYHLNY